MMKQHDKNAIAVRRYDGEIVGHLTRDTGARLAPFLQLDTCVFGKVSETYYGEFQTSIIIIIVERIIESRRHAIFK